MHKTVYILGTGHCGSTLLGLILGSHSKCEYIGEFSFLYDDYNKKVNIKRIRQTGFCTLCGKDCTYFGTRKTHGELYEMFGKEYLIDNSKKVEFARDTMNENSKLIFITRHPVSLLGSYKKTNELSSKKIGSLFRKKWSILNFLRDKEHLKIKYKDLSNPEAIKGCCKYIGIEFEESMVRYWEKNHHGNVPPYILQRNRIEVVDRSNLIDAKDKKMAVKYGLKSLMRKLKYE